MAALEPLMKKLETFVHQVGVFEATSTSVIPIRFPNYFSLRNSYYVVLLQQELRQQKGIVRVNCLDCLDRTNFVQTELGQMSNA